MVRNAARPDKRLATEPAGTSVSTCLNCSFPILIWWGPQLVKLYNDAYAVILGDKHPGALGTPGQQVWPEIWDTIGPMLGRVMDQGEATPADDLPLVLHRHGYPEPCWFSFSYSPIRDEAGQVAGVFCPVIETTARVLAERRAAFLFDLERPLRDAASPLAVKEAVCELLGRHLGVAQVGYSELEPDGEHVLIEGTWSCSPGAGVSGRHRLDDYGQPLIAELRRNQVVAVSDVEQDSRTSAPDSLESHAAIHVRSLLDVPLIKGDRLVAILFAADAAPRMWTDDEAALLREVAERTWTAVGRTRAEMAVQAQKTQLEGVIGTVPAAVWFTEDPDARYVVGNRFAADLLRTPNGTNPSMNAPAGQQHTYFQMVRDGAVVPPDLLPIRRAARGEDVPLEEFEAQFPDGGAVTILTRATPLRDASGRVTGAVCAAIDVTERKQAEAALRTSEDALRRVNEQLETRVAAEVAAREQAQASLAQAQRLEALGQLAGGIAHDFNNVLQAVSGGLSLIGRRADDPAAVRELARMAEAAAKRGASITGRLLSFARKGELQAMPVPPAALLDDLREMLTPTLGVSIQVVTSADPDAPPLLADRAQLETVLVNLAVNARDAMPDGGTLRIAVTVEAVVDSHPAELGIGAYVRLDLADTGTGMSAATLARASEPFFTTKPPGQGTGLGLAMARGFAEQSNGGFALRSTPGQGTTVTLWFPLASGVAQVEAVVDEPAPPPAAASARVLLVDDDAMVRAVLAGHLEARGYRVIQASDGLDALARLDAGEAADLLVTDFAMPGMNGLALIGEARRRLPGIPVLLLTGYADATVRLHAEDTQAGNLALLRKPVSGDELAASAAASLNGSARAAE